MLRIEENRRVRKLKLKFDKKHLEELSKLDQALVMRGAWFQLIEGGPDYRIMMIEEKEADSYIAALRPMIEEVS